MSFSENASGSSPSAPEETIVEEVLGCFDVYARFRRARDSILNPVRFSPRDEQRAYDDLQRAISRLRTVRRQLDRTRPVRGPS
ncbi:hypothetical protein [Streptomyces sp. NPDC056452]|uniref:hypothetical protein n=1 Tax=Streptomyces sp. NPDC056452 TaxID=3345821 RepID=UPI0036920279